MRYTFCTTRTYYQFTLKSNNAFLHKSCLWTDGQTDRLIDRQTDRRRDRWTDRQRADDNGTCSSQWYLPVAPTGPCESGKPRGPHGPGCDTEPAGPAGPESTRGPGTPDGPGKSRTLVAPVTPASPRSPGGLVGPENSVSFTLSVFHFYNSNIGITSCGAQRHVPTRSCCIHSNLATFSFPV